MHQAAQNLSYGIAEAEAAALMVVALLIKRYKEQWFCLEERSDKGCIISVRWALFCQLLPAASALQDSKQEDTCST